MKYMELKGLYVFIKIVFGLIVLVLLWTQWDSHNRSLANGYYMDYGSGNSIKSTKDTRVFVGGILDYNYDENHIIAKRFPRMNYSCSNPTSLESYFIQKIQYIIIDTKHDIVFTTFNKNIFQNKLKNLKISMKFKMTSTDIINFINKRYNWFYKEKNRIEYMKQYCRKNKEYLVNSRK